MGDETYFVQDSFLSDLWSLLANDDSFLKAINYIKLNYYLAFKRTPLN